MRAADRTAAAPRRHCSRRTHPAPRSAGHGRAPRRPAGRGEGDVHPAAFEVVLDAGKDLHLPKILRERGRNVQDIGQLRPLRQAVLADEGAAAAALIDQPLLLELLERGAHRYPADVERPAQVVLRRQPVVMHQMALLDVIEDILLCLLGLVRGRTIRRSSFPFLTRSVLRTLYHAKGKKSRVFLLPAAKADGEQLLRAQRQRAIVQRLVLFFGQRRAPQQRVGIERRGTRGRIEVEQAQDQSAAPKLSASRVPSSRLRTVASPLVR